MAIAAVHADAPRRRARPPTRRRLGPVVPGLSRAGRAHRSPGRSDAAVRTRRGAGVGEVPAVTPGGSDGRPRVGGQGEVRLGSTRCRTWSSPVTAGASSKPQHPAMSTRSANCSSTGSPPTSSTPSATPPRACFPHSTNPRHRHDTPTPPSTESTTDSPDDGRIRWPYLTHSGGRRSLSPTGRTPATPCTCKPRSSARSASPTNPSSTTGGTPPSTSPPPDSPPP